MTIIGQADRAIISRGHKQGRLIEVRDSSLEMRNVRIEGGRAQVKRTLHHHVPCIGPAAAYRPSRKRLRAMHGVTPPRCTAREAYVLSASRQLQWNGGGILVEAFSDGVVVAVRIIASVFANCAAAADSYAVSTQKTAAPLPAPLPSQLRWQ